MVFAPFTSPLHNHQASTITKTRFLHPGEGLGYALTGSEMSIGIWDQGGVLVNHQELENRVIKGDNANPRRHATGVAGTLAATGIHSEAKGMAYQAELLSFDWNSDIVEMFNEAEQGLLLSNHSYGVTAGWIFADVEQRGNMWYWFGDPTVSEHQDVTFGRYSSRAAQLDIITATNPFFLPLVAAGNDRDERGPTSGTYRGLSTYGFWTTFDINERPVEQDGGLLGYDSIGGMAVAKNILTVGAIETDETGSPRVTSFSSFGPVDDGRIKPDIMGYGARVVSSFSLDPSSYGISGGTSIATANVSGSLVLFQEHYHDLIGSPMRAASLKGLVIHTAQDLGAPGPDYQLGWGLLDAEAAIDQISSISKNPLALHEHVLEEGYTHLYVLQSNQATSLRVTLSWTDPPSKPLELTGPSALNAPISHLINDLDVRLYNSTDGEIIYPYVLAPLQPDQPSYTGDNKVDPVEQISISSPSSAEYVVSISHKDSLWSQMSQPYSLLVSGAQGVETEVVAMQSIQAVVQTDTVSLRWKALVAHEGGVIHLERAVVNDSGKSPFKRINTFHPLSSTPALEAYSFHDLNLMPGQYRYRLTYSDGTLTHTFPHQEVIVQPVLIGQMQAHVEEKHVILEWDTAAELNPVIYHVERAKIECQFVPGNNDSVFVHRGTLTAQGPALQRQAYRFRDPIIDSGCYRYRVLAEDLTSMDLKHLLADTEVYIPNPNLFAILSNFPNPFKEKTSIIVDLVYPYLIPGGRARVEVFDTTGRRVALLHEGHLPPGRQQFPFDASGLASGVYFVRFSLSHHRAQQIQGEQILTHPLIVVE